MRGLGRSEVGAVVATGSEACNQRRRSDAFPVADRAAGIALPRRLGRPRLCRHVAGAYAMSVAAPRIHEVPDDLLAAIDYCYDQGWTDGLPVVPPVVDRVKAMLAADRRPADTVIAHHPATGLDLSLHAAAVNAVMAGCLPDYFPVVVAAFEAMDKP